MNSYTQLSNIIDDLKANGVTPKVTKLKTRKPRKGELVMSMTKGSRTNTNRRGQSYSGATVTTHSIIEGNSNQQLKLKG